MKSAAVAAGVPPANSQQLVTPKREGGPISLLANHANKRFFHALTSQSYETPFFTVNSSIVTRCGFSLCAGSQKLSCGRRVGVPVNSTNHRVSDRSRD